MERIVHSAERLQIIEALKHTPIAVQEAIAGVPEGVLRFKATPQDWSVKEIVGHLRDKAEIWGLRLYMVSCHNDPLLPLFDGEASVRDHDYQNKDPGPLLAEMRQLRSQTVDLLDHTVDWSRLGRHPEIGRRSLKQWAEYLVEMEHGHLDQIKANKAAAQAAGVHHA